jgi:hypothetical protein
VNQNRKWNVETSSSVSRPDPSGYKFLIKTQIIKSGYRLASKIKDEGFKEDLYTKHWCTCSLCPVHTGRIECCQVLASFCG